jgi:hypothetical protein
MICSDKLAWKGNPSILSSFQIIDWTEFLWLKKYPSITPLASLFEFTIAGQPVIIHAGVSSER